MSELINNSEKRKELLKHMILQLHEGIAPQEANKQLVNLLKKIPYGEVVEVEQELLSEGVLSEQEVLKFCDIHTQALEGHIDLSAMKIIPPGHPVDVFKQENKELKMVTAQVREKIKSFNPAFSQEEVKTFFRELRSLFNLIMDVDKHYVRKENLLFPYLEKYGITGPPKVMWGKHDETRELLKASFEGLAVVSDITGEEAEALFEMVLIPALTAVEDMTMKEDEILLPMCMDKLTDVEWYEIHKQTPEIGFCLYDPEFDWAPENIEAGSGQKAATGDIIQLPSGNFTAKELLAILNTLPVDITFVDSHDKVRYFSQGSERIFQRNRAILNRDVKMCHPPSSVGIVEQILDDFKSGKQDHAPFWIGMKGKFIHIEYFALRDESGNYLGTLEVSQDLTAKRKLTGEQRILSYESPSEINQH